MPIQPKYRELTSEELSELEKEFVEYLIINGITADEWVKLKAEEKEKAEDIITLFSDVVFEGVMQKITYLEKRLNDELMTFQCLKDRLVLVAITSESMDFSKPDSLQNLSEPPPDAKVYTSEKKYVKQREIELFEMIQAGCNITDGKLFKTLSLAL